MIKNGEKPRKTLEISRLKRVYTHFDVIHYLSERIMQSVKERETFQASPRSQALYVMHP